MKLRRGFVRESEEYALEFRAELGLDPTAPLPARVLAEHLNVPVLELSKLGSLPPVMAMRVVRPGGTFFFGAIIPDGTFRAILHNDFVAPNRQSSDIMHELAHIILGHPVYPLMGLSGARIYNPTYENEAKELSFALMIPKCAALRIVESRMPLSVASKEYLASAEAIEFRIRKTDVRRWAENRRKKAFCSVV